MKLVLDEHYSPRIAEQLRKRGHDVVSVGERSDLRGATDRALLEQMRREGRAIRTNNVRDFMPLIHEAVASGEGHNGVVFTSDRAWPRSTAAIGELVRALDELLRARGSDNLLNEVLWLARGSA